MPQAELPTEVTRLRGGSRWQVGAVPGSSKQPRTQGPEKGTWSFRSAANAAGVRSSQLSGSTEMQSAHSTVSSRTTLIRMRSLWLLSAHKRGPYLRGRARGFTADRLTEAYETDPVAYYYYYCGHYYYYYYYYYYCYCYCYYYYYYYYYCGYYCCYHYY